MGIMLLLQALFALCMSNFAAALELITADNGTGIIHMYYRTGWSAPYIHYTKGSGWTTAPGVKMSVSTNTTTFPPSLGWFYYDVTSTTLEFDFNNGAGTWDNNNNANYKVTQAGTWAHTSTISTPPTAAPTPSPTPSPSAVGTTLVSADNGTGLYIYFRCGWTAPYIHYTNGSGWTTSPGVKMLASTNTTTFPPSLGWFYYHFAAPANYLQFVFNNGAGTWDNNNNVNYQASSAGTWSVVSTVSTPPTAAPATTTATPSTTTVTPSTTTTTPSTPTTAVPAPTTTPSPTSDCTNYNGLDSCSSSTTVDYPDTNDARKWQTPPRNASGWGTQYKDYR